TRRAAGPGMRAAARWHRRHLGARSARVSAAGHVLQLPVRHPRRASPGHLPGRDRKGAGLMSQPGESQPSVEEFAARARAWLAGNMPRRDPQHPPRNGRDDEDAWQRARELQRLLYDGGFAGICFPREYGGLGLDISYQRAFDVESDGYEMPLILNVPTFTIC